MAVGRLERFRPVILLAAILALPIALISRHAWGMVFAATAVLAFVLASLRSLEFICLATLLAVPVLPATRLGPFPINADDLLPPFILALVALRIAITKRVQPIHSPVKVPLLVFVLWGTLTFFLSLFDRPASLGYGLFFLKWLEVHVSFLIPHLIIRDLRQGRRCFWVMVLAANIVAVVGLLQFFTGWPVFDPITQGEHVQVRVVSTFSRPNALAMYLLLNLAISFYLGMTARESLSVRARAFLLGSAFLQFLALLATGSRTGLMGFGLLALIGLRVRRIAPLIVICAALLAIASLAGLAPDEGSVLARFSIAYQRPGIGAPGLSADAMLQDPRWSTWHEALDHVLEAPLFGLGLPLWTQGHTSHNYLLTTAVAMGIPGAFIAIWLYTRLFQGVAFLARRTADPFHRRLAGIFTAFLAALFLSSLFDETMIHPQLMFQVWFLTGMLAVSVNLPPAPIHGHGPR